MTNFYDDQAKKFGGYAFSSNKPKYTSKYFGGDPEAVFLSKILELAKPQTIALDVGCGDGKFTFEIVTKFSKIVGLDSSKDLLAVAEQKKKEIGIKNIKFVFGDAKQTPFRNNSFDIIFNRRGPSFYAEYARLLKANGYYVEIGIGEKDAMEIKQVFGRGQNYGDWDRPRLDTDASDFTNLGLKIVFAQNYFYTEYYASQHEFEIFLQGVPIFEDFDLNKDRKYLNEYYKTNMDREQVALNRHRVVYVVKK
jgi:ubiquinone/menaquinone biosynthesis C-methylase UbiE